MFTSRYEETDYIKKLDKAVIKDTINPKNNHSSFYAIMIFSNYKKSEIIKVLDYYK